MTPESSNVDSRHDINDILARFDDAPMCDMHTKPFFQDGGDDDEYCE